MTITPERKLAVIAEYATTNGDTGSPEVQVAVLSERINSSPGVPLISRSSGTVISCSTSSAASPGSCVVTCAETSPSSG